MLRASRAALSAAAILVGSFAVGTAQEAPAPSGTITIDSTQIAFLVSGNFGGGKLHFQGRTYPFSVGGLGVGGIGVSSIEASGEVYHLDSIDEFPGVYGSARVGWTFGDSGQGNLWLENPNGVVLHLKARTQGLALSAGVDGVAIQLD